jgi:hypothetical protein
VLAETAKPTPSRMSLIGKNPPELPRVLARKQETGRLEVLHIDAKFGRHGIAIGLTKQYPQERLRVSRPTQM